MEGEPQGLEAAQESLLLEDAGRGVEPGTEAQAGLRYIEVSDTTRSVVNAVLHIAAWASGYAAAQYW